ncbi:MAG: type II 3-dehydroquinate dehydratase [Paludibacteraceae bacterium]|nr:type II 3-dehydroquinate dehydratase [Candidatus Colicola coprequi]MCQ2333300.1 type II 3-dehydroquinate dehydratase [Paludibacteraceae bacterium]
MKIVILNGPNLNRLGHRNPDVYGTQSMEQVLLAIQNQWQDVYFEYHQSNHEGDLIDYIQQFDGQVNGIVLNPGGYAHTSVALRDAIEDAQTPVIEVHISDITQRESFRRNSLITDVCHLAIIGKGIDGYKEAVKYIIDSLA